MIHLLTTDWQKWLEVKDDSTKSNETEAADRCSDTKQPSSLLDLAAQTSAKYCSSSEIVGHRPHLDEPLLRKVAYWSFPKNAEQMRAYAYMLDKLDNVRKALLILADKRLIEMCQVGFMTIAYITKHGRLHYEPTTSREPGNEIKVSVVAEKQRILSTSCSECTDDIMCRHIIAAVIERSSRLDKITVHSPLMDCLSIRDRDQLQNLLEYAVNQDPAEILREIFCHLNESGGLKSEIASVDGAPDPTCGGLQEGEKCQWDLILDEMSTRYLTDLDYIIKLRSKLFSCEGLLRKQRCNRLSWHYQDNYDMAMKRQCRVSGYINPVLELVRDEEYLHAAKVLHTLISLTVKRMTTTPRATCPHLSRLFHDLSHIHALLVLRTEDKEARSVLLDTANEIKPEAVKEHILQTSDWSELSSLTQLFPHETEKLSTEGCMMIESVLANQLQPNPQHLCRLLDGTDNCDNTSYNEDVIVILARLESLFLFEKEQCAEKISRLGFLILRKLSLLAQKYSVLGQLTSSYKSDSGAPSSLINLFCPGPPATSTKQPMDTDSVLGEGFTVTQEPNKETASQPKRQRFNSKSETENLESSTDFVWSVSHISYAMLQTLGMIIHVESDKNLVDSINRKDLVAFCLLALELSRYHMLAVFNVSSADPNSINHEPSSCNSERPLATSFSQSESPVISQVEHDWCLKLETTVCDYLGKIGVEDYCEPFSMYIDCVSSIGTSFYLRSSAQDGKENGMYSFVLLEVLCQLCSKSDALKESKGKLLKKICSEILLGSVHCQVYNILQKEESLYNPQKTSSKSKQSRRQRSKAYHDAQNNYSLRMHDFAACCTPVKFQDICVKYCTDFAVKKYHYIFETFLSSMDAESTEDSFLFIKMMQRLESVHNFSLLQLIGKELRTHAELLRDDLVASILLFCIHYYRQMLIVIKSAPIPNRSDPPYVSMFSPQPPIPDGVVEKEFIFSLVKKLDMSALPVFLKVWQDIFTCKQLQDLALYLEVTEKAESCDSENSSLSPKVLAIVDEFYDSKLSHDEDACTLLKRFFTPGSAQYTRIFDKIITTWENYDCGALLNLAKLQHSTAKKIDGCACSPAQTDSLAVSKSAGGNQTSCDGTSSAFISMDQETFDIVEKAFKKLGSTTITATVLEAVEWVCNLCVKCETKLEEKSGAEEERKEITSLPFYDKLIRCVCKHARAQPKVVLKVLEVIDTISGGISSSYLAQHVSVIKLRSTLLDAYKEDFAYRTKDYGETRYHVVMDEMLAAKMICKKFVPNGDQEFHKVVVQNLRDMHSKDETLMLLLGRNFRSSVKTKKNK